MSKRKDGQERGKYTLEFKLEAVRLVSAILASMLFTVLLAACGGGGGGTDNITVPTVNVVGPGQFKDAVLLKTVTSSQIAAAIKLAGKSAFRATPRYAVQAYRMTYLTLDGLGQQIFASALLAVPQKPGNALSPVFSYQHGTIAMDADAPSNLADIAGPEVILASLGYIVLSADYVGYGASKGAVHPYLSSGPSASAVVDMLTAARYWRQTQHVPDNKQLFLAGYSEGGYVTMATHRALQDGTAPERNQIVSVAPGAGPYNVGLTLDEDLKIVRQQYPLLGALLNPDFLKYISDADRHNVRDLLLQQLLGSSADVSFMPTFLDNYMADDRTSIGIMSDVYNWRPDAPVYLFHGRDDLTVSYLNATSTLQAMQARGSGNLVSLTDCTAQPAGHSECVLPYWQFILDTFAKVAKDL
jgi:pimeloyl-ACP methyl ester carboxylesterase